MGSLREQYLSLGDRELLAQCDVDTYRASGPGGQKRNKTDSAVRLRHKPTRLVAMATESRSQHENRARALRRLRQAMALNLREPFDQDHRPQGEGVIAGLASSEVVRLGRRDQRYNVVVGEILDLFQASGCRVAPTARKLGISTGQFVTFAGRDPKLWALVNRMREEAGLGILRSPSK